MPRARVELIYERSARCDRPLHETSVARVHAKPLIGKLQPSLRTSVLEGALH